MPESESDASFGMQSFANAWFRCIAVKCVRALQPVVFKNGSAQVRPSTASDLKAYVPMQLPQFDCAPKCFYRAISIKFTHAKKVSENTEQLVSKPRLTCSYGAVGRGHIPNCHVLNACAPNPYAVVSRVLDVAVLQREALRGSMHVEPVCSRVHRDQIVDVNVRVPPLFAVRKLRHPNRNLLLRNNTKLPLSKLLFGPLGNRKTGHIFHLTKTSPSTKIRLRVHFTEIRYGAGREVLVLVGGSRVQPLRHSH